MKTYNVHWETLRDYCQVLLMSRGVPERDARIVAESLVEAELCGVASHGVSRMSIYLKRLEEGVVNPAAKITVLQESASSLALDADNGMGMVAGVYAMRRCIEKAKESGCCFASVRHSNHYGMASTYARMAAEEGMIGFTSTNAPPNIAPWGSCQPYNGTNPIAIASPTPGQPVVLDMAPSVVAMGKIIFAAKMGKSIPEGWGLTKEGKPTTDAKLASEGSVLPIGGPKGSGLAIFVDILCGILAGAQFGPHINNMWNDFKNPQDVGHVFFALDISKFEDPDVFRKRIGQMIQEIKSLPKNPGVQEIFLPGELEQTRADRARAQGIELSDIVYEELRALGEKKNIEFTL